MNITEDSNIEDIIHHHVHETIKNMHETEVNNRLSSFQPNQLINPDIQPSFNDMIKLHNDWSKCYKENFDPNDTKTAKFLEESKITIIKNISKLITSYITGQPLEPLDDTKEITDKLNALNAEDSYIKHVKNIIQSLRSTSRFWTSGHNKLADELEKTVFNTDIKDRDGVSLPSQGQLKAQLMQHKEKFKIIEHELPEIKTTPKPQ